MRPPIYSALAKHASKQRVKFCSPGHKGKIRMRTDNLCKIDVESTGFEKNGYELELAIQKSQEEISGIFGSAKSFYLTGGADSGIYAVLSSVCNPGDKVILDPECSVAFINAITILALDPVFLKRSYCAKYGVNGGISTKEMEYAIEHAPDAKLMILSSPTYHGVCANIKKASVLVHNAGMKLFVDESFGAHFNFSKSFPETALECGADMVVHSLSKTLGGFCGSGLLHISASVEDKLIRVIKSNLDIYQRGSFSTAQLCASENILFYVFENAYKYGVLLREIERGKYLLTEKTNILWFDSENNNGADIVLTDKTKIVLNFSQLNITGHEAASILKNKFGIEADYADNEMAVFSVSIYNSATEIRKLVNSCLSISKSFDDERKKGEETALENIELFDEGPRTVMSPYKAFYCNAECVDASDSIGRICRKPICKMPSGIPIIIPGEKISREQIDAIIEMKECEVEISGLCDDGKIEVLSLSDSFYF